MNPLARRLLATADLEPDPHLRANIVASAERLNLRDEVMGCDACSLRRLSGIAHPYPAKGPTPATLAVVIDQPTKRDVRGTGVGQLLAPSTPAGAWFDELLDVIGLTRAHVWLTAATYCPTHTTRGAAVDLGTRNAHTATCTHPNPLGHNDRRPSDPGYVEQVGCSECLAAYADPVATCIDLYAARGLNLSRAPVVLCMGERALLVAKHHHAFAPAMSFAITRAAQPVLQAGRWWVSTWGIEQAFALAADNDPATRTRRMHEVRAAVVMVGELLADVQQARAEAVFAGSVTMEGSNR